MRLKYMLNKSIILFIIVILSGCATAPPKVQDDTSSAIAISVLVDSLSFRIRSKPSGVENLRIDHVFFIKLNSLNDSILKQDFIVSNYVYESLKASFQFDAVDSFSMNVEPGIYAAVGAVGMGRTSGDIFLIYFPKEMIETSVRKVYPNTVTYMGKFFLDRVTSLNIMGLSKNQPRMGTAEKPDSDPQVFYPKNYAFDLIKLTDGETVISKYGRPIAVLSSLSESLCSKSDEIIFLNNHIKTFAGTEWILKVRNRLNMIEN